MSTSICSCNMQWIFGRKTVTCPLHGWIYSLESGKALGSNARLLTYHIFEDEGLVWLEQPKKTRPLWLENF